MTWWPVAAMTAATVFVASTTALLAAPAVMPLCGEDAGFGTAVACDALLSFIRGLVVLSGAALAAALVAALHAALASRAMRGREDSRPLVSIHARRR